eukprot:TRINITY_DN6010_c2_g1_i1.p1 TRINITY_DN6010_c2_g1~~TRINITY_DN6010_c2_g1_i1.p1  ORF type:complete len:727 (+),score=255.55 TRINITY_DN6010_c2_g1_i1:104-2182(+)
MAKTLLFEPIAVQVKVEFWHRLEQKKLHELRLSTDPVPIRYFYAASNQKGRSQRAEVRGDGFDAVCAPSELDVSAPGTLHNTNTVEDFRAASSADKRKGLLQEEGARLWAAICSRAWRQDPSVLCPLLLLSFADLKKHEFSYHVALPALGVKPPIACDPPPREARTVFQAVELQMLSGACQAARGPQGCAAHQPAFILRRAGDGSFAAGPLSSISPADAQPLRDGSAWLVAVDPSGNGAQAGWPLRNLLLAVALELRAGELHCISLRDNPDPSIGAGHSLVCRCTVPVQQLPELPEGGGAAVPLPPALGAVGWQRFPGKEAGEHQSVDLSAMMDDKKLAQSSAHLNLSLMKWRMVPALDLDMLGQTKCLLIGSGTLGCNVARNLMMWGMHNFTLVDRSNVSFSNPVRQSLFCHADALDGGRNKAEAAADACRRIYPLSGARSERLFVPMPGHPVGPGSVEDVRQTCAKLHSLIREHDVTFLLTDSRESRWLPTLLCAAESKPVLNAALGFDSYVVMRHGVPGGPTPERRVGCYFCSDVTSPSDSLSDRTLDQQCTVTRAGVSSLASALAVELLVSLLSHPDREHAAAPGAEDDSRDAGLLGTVPHQIRGRVFAFDQMLLRGEHFDQCVACGARVLAEFRQRGFDFLLDVFNREGVLAEVSGVKEMMAAADSRMADILDADFDIDDDDDDDDA